MCTGVPTYVSGELDGEASPDGDDGHADALVDSPPQEPPTLHRHVCLYVEIKCLFYIYSSTVYVLVQGSIKYIYRNTY